MPFHVFPPSASEPLTSLGSISSKKESSLANGSTLSRRLRNLGQQHSIGDVGPGYPWVIILVLPPTGRVSLDSQLNLAL